MDTIEFRKYNQEDTNEVVGLLDLALGSEGTPKTKEYWIWKHLHNPFGESYILLALVANKIAGVRAFMKWHFKKEGQIIDSVRAVDTATHPDYRGLGIFKNLTLKIIEEIKREEKISFIFNTPNNNSMPGYLKMGWKMFGKSNIKLKFASIFTLLLNRVRNKNFKKFKIKKNHSCQNLVIDNIINSIVEDNKLINRIYFFTDYSNDYLRWRYINVPPVNYGYLLNENKWVLFFRLKRTKGLYEIRITDFFVHTNFEDFKLLKKEISNLLKSYEADVITFNGERGYVSEKILPKLGFINIGHKGICITLRELKMPFSEIDDKNKWAWTAGDLELF